MENSFFQRDFYAWSYVALSHGCSKFMEENNIDLNLGGCMLLLKGNMNYRAITAHKLVQKMNIKPVYRIICWDSRKGTIYNLDANHGALQSRKTDVKVILLDNLNQKFLISPTNGVQK